MSDVPAGRVTITRRRLFLRTDWLYEAVGADGRRFDNRNIAELRRVLRIHYGRELRIIETWKPSR